jgi:hypothetical protein
MTAALRENKRDMRYLLWWCVTRLKNRITTAKRNCTDLTSIAAANRHIQIRSSIPPAQFNCDRDMTWAVGYCVAAPSQLFQVLRSSLITWRTQRK